MSTGCRFLNPLRRDGTSQRQRAAKALDPGHARIEERTLADLLLYAREYAELLRYYTRSNSPGGDWVDFVADDVSAIVALMGGEELEASRKVFQKRVSMVEAAPPASVLVAYADLLDPILGLAATINLWHGKLAKELRAWQELDRLIRAALNDALRAALVISLRIHQLDPTIDSIQSAVDELGDIWEMSTVEPDELLFADGLPVSADDLEHALRRIGSLFDRFYEARVFLAKSAVEYLRQTMEKYPRHQPHMALFLAFLRLYRHARNHLNSLGGEHLAFYYEKVLRLRRKPARPDSAHVLFELAKNAKPRLVDKDTALNGGKDGSGVLRLYETTGDLVVNRAVVDAEHGLKTVFVETTQSDPSDESTRRVVNLFAASDADSGDGLGGDLEDQDGKWAALGSTSMPFAELGFALASPMFLLSEGDRTVTIGLHLSKRSTLNVAAVADELRRNVRLSVTGEEGWLSLPVGDVKVQPHGLRGMAFHFTVGADQGPIVAYDAKLHGGVFDTGLPMVRFMLDPDGLAAGEYTQLDADHPEDKPVGTAELGIVDYSDEVAGYSEAAVVRYRGHLYRARTAIVDAGVQPDSDATRWRELEHAHPYRHFQKAEIVDVDVDLDIDGVRGLVLESDVGSLDPAKPFLPFGPVPKAGSSFYVGSAEIFAKPLTRLELGIEWADLPQESFQAHYAEYGPLAKTGTPPPVEPIIKSNDDFKARVSLLYRGRWRAPEVTKSSPRHKQLKLFETLTGKQAPATARTMPLTVSPALASAPALADFARFDASQRRGFLRLTLGDRDFLHRSYPQYLARAAASGQTHLMPNQPYTPLMASLTLDYDASHSFGYRKSSKNDFEDRVDRLFQIGPFGHREVYPITEDASATTVPIDRSLVPRFEVTVETEAGGKRSRTAEGTLFIGFDKLAPEQNLSLLFRVAEGSEDPQAVAQRVVWSYLARDEWVDFQKTQILADGTNGLLGSGIVKFVMPKQMTVSTALMPGKLHWIKASVHRHTGSVPKLVSVRTQAAVARFRDRKNDPAHLGTALPAGTIAKLMSRDAAIKSVSQPYASFDGRLEETDPAFRVRVSERLRHKWRGISIFDYERLVLERFPEVHKVKCLNHSSLHCEHAPGEVKIVVVPDLRNQNAVDRLRPRLSLNKLELIRAFLDQLSSDFVTVHVANPSYERVRANFQVRFVRGRDQGLHTTKLQQDLVKFLSPWLYVDAADLTLGGRVHRSEILNFVEELDYVDFVTEFTLDQFVDVAGVEKRLKDVEEAVATTSSAALVSAVEHVIGHDVKSCVDHG